MNELIEFRELVTDVVGVTLEFCLFLFFNSVFWNNSKSKSFSCFSCQSYTVRFKMKQNFVKPYTSTLLQKTRQIFKQLCKLMYFTSCNAWDVCIALDVLFVCATSECSEHVFFSSKLHILEKLSVNLCRIL